MIPMHSICPRCDGKHGVEVSGDGYEWDCAACGQHLICAIGLDGGEMFPYHREDGTCGCNREPHTCDMDEADRAELLADHCVHEQLSGTFGDKSRSCLACGREFVACRGCYVLGSGMPVYHDAPECPITDEEWAEVRRKEMADV